MMPARPERIEEAAPPTLDVLHLIGRHVADLRSISDSPRLRRVRTILKTAREEMERRLGGGNQG